MIVNTFFLDKEKDIIVDLIYQEDYLFYRITTPYHSSGNLLYNLSKVCKIPLLQDENKRYYIYDQIPSFIDLHNNKQYILYFDDIKVASIDSQFTVRQEAIVLAVSKILMSQTKEYHLPLSKTLVSTFIKEDEKFITDLHTHMNANLYPEQLIALGLVYNIYYPYYYVKKLNIELTKSQYQKIEAQRLKVIEQYKDINLKGKYFDRKIDDNTYVNFADLLLNNKKNQSENITKIKNSLAILKDGQAVFTNLEKLYLYRYVFCKPKLYNKEFKLNIDNLNNPEIKQYVFEIIHYQQEYNFNFFQMKLLLIAKNYQEKGIKYVEISDTSFTKKDLAVELLKLLHSCIPIIYAKTGVLIRFLCAIRRIPLTIKAEENGMHEYLKEAICVIKAISFDPYIAGLDIVGEEINDINELNMAFKELVPILKVNKNFVFRVHAGENDNLKNNVLKSIELVLNNNDDQNIKPNIRIGHGLFTNNLNTNKGKELIDLIKQNNVSLEFQLTSNVRLNNLNNFEKHPLKKYLSLDINCLQGSDGCALYGTDSIEEQLALKTLLQLSKTDFLKMKNTENTIYNNALKDYEEKIEKCQKYDHLFERYKQNIELTLNAFEEDLISSSRLFESKAFFKDRYQKYDDNKIAIVVIGGSFNADKRITKMNDKELNMLEALNKLDPKKYYFVIAHKLKAYENIVYHNLSDKFDIYTIVPTKMYKYEINRLLNEKIKVHLSNQVNVAGLYKSYNFEIFEQRPSILLAIDGNASCVNIIQEAKNGKAKSKILISKYSPYLTSKALNLSGYVKLVSNKEELINEIESFNVKI